MRTGPLIAVVAASALVAVPAGEAPLDQLGVKTSRLYEQQPAAATEGGTAYFAWSRNPAPGRTTSTPFSPARAIRECS